MHQPVEEADRLYVSKPVEVAAREKTKLLCEYFIYLSLYQGNGVNVTYCTNHRLDRLQQCEYFMVKRRQLTFNTAMVYLLDKYISFHNIKISGYNVRWGTSYEYEENKFITFEIEYNTKGEATYYSIEITDYVTNKNGTVIYDNNVLSIYMSCLLIDFFNEIDRIFNVFQTQRNKAQLDKLQREFSERIGKPDVHLPIETEFMS
jgi:hypothetical protein